MGDIAHGVATDIPSNSTATTPDPPASADVICEEFLKVLGRKEVEQPMIWYVQVGLSSQTTSLTPPLTPSTPPLICTTHG
jgi:hypothetical protein